MLNEPLKLQWRGVIAFQTSSALPNYPTDNAPSLTGVAAPLDNNLLQARLIDSVAFPKPTFAINYLVEFEDDEDSGVNRAFVNGQSFRPSKANSAKGIQFFHSLIFNINFHIHSFRQHFSAIQLSHA